MTKIVFAILFFAFSFDSFADSTLTLVGYLGRLQKDATFKACPVERDQKGRPLPLQYIGPDAIKQKCITGQLNAPTVVTPGFYLVMFNETLTTTEIAAYENKQIVLTNLAIPQINGFFQYLVSKNYWNQDEFDKKLFYEWVFHLPVFEIGKSQVGPNQYCKIKMSDSTVKAFCDAFASGDYKNLRYNYMAATDYNDSYRLLRFALMSTLPLRIDTGYTNWDNWGDPDVQPRHLLQSGDYVSVLPGSYSVEYTGTTGYKYLYRPEYENP